VPYRRKKLTFAISSPDEFLCYLVSYLANTIAVDSDINSRLAKAGDAFDKLQRRLWSEHSVSLPVKIAVYQAVVLSMLLYGCESWVLYRRSVRKLDEFHMRCLRRIASINWQDRVPNTEVLHLCGTTGIEAFLLQAQFRWVVHEVRMQDDRIPKQILYGQLSSGKCPQCGPVRRYKDTVRGNLKRCGILPQSLISAPLDRGQWRSTCRTAIAAFEEARVASLQRKRAARKHQVVSTNTAWPCDRCNKVCSSRIGLFAQRRTHR